MNRIALGAALVAGAVLLTAPARATAQGLELDLRLTPRAGLLTPADWIYEEFKNFGANPMQWTRGVVRKAPLAGLTAELELGGTGVWLRGEVLGTLGGEAALLHTVYTPPSTAGPATTTHARYVIPARVILASFDVALPTALRLPYGVQPYVTAGIGGKTYHFDTASVLELEDALVLPEDGTTFAYNVGAGGTFRVGDLGFDLLVRDAISKYWEKTQHDVMVLGGVSWRVF